MAETETPKTPQSSWGRFMSFVTSLRDSEGMSDRDVRSAVDAALRAVEPGYMGIDTLYPDDGMVIFYVAPEDTYQAMRRDYTLADGKATLGDLREKVEAKLTYVAADAHETVIVPLPDETVVITLTPRAAGCGCAGEKTMDKTKKAELIAALVTDVHSGFKEGDEAFLETASDDRLLEFQTAATSRKAAAAAATQSETDARNANARVKVAEEKLKAKETPRTEEEWMADAPASVKALIERQKAQETELRSSLVSKLKTAQAEYTEEELNAMDTATLERTARIAKVGSDAPSYVGRGVPVQRGAANSVDEFAAPDPYKAGLDKMRAATASKAVN